MASVPAPLRWPSASPRKSSPSRIAITMPVAENSPATATLAEPASPMHAARSAISVLRMTARLSPRRAVHRASAYQLVDLDDRQQDGEHDHQHHGAHHQDHHRLEQREEHRQASLERLRLEARAALQHLLELAAHLAARHKVHEKRREGARLAERAGRAPSL